MGGAGGQERKSQAWVMRRVRSGSGGEKREQESPEQQGVEQFVQPLSAGNGAVSALGELKGWREKGNPRKPQEETESCHQCYLAKRDALRGIPGEACPAGADAPLAGWRRKEQRQRGTWRPGSHRAA